MPVAVGERVLITKNNRKASLINGDLLEVKAIDQNRDLTGKRAPVEAAPSHFISDRVTRSLRKLLKAARRLLD
jgi:hypothetical protein